jgi:hypothetical protein
VVFSLSSVVLLTKEGERETVWNLVIGAFLEFGVWDLEFPPVGWKVKSPCGDLCALGSAAIMYVQLYEE